MVEATKKRSRNEKIEEEAERKLNEESGESDETDNSLKPVCMPLSPKTVLNHFVNQRFGLKNVKKGIIYS